MAPADEPKSKDDAKSVPKDDRQARLEAALRANLRKRKQQSRTRAPGAAKPAEGETGPEKA